MKKKKILLVSNVSWSAYFRKNLILALHDSGYDVHVAASPDHYREKLQSLPVTFHPLKLAPKGKNPFVELYTLLFLFILLLKVKPDACLNFSIKPVLYNSIVCRMLHTPVINNIPGVGDALEKKSGLLSSVVLFLYKISQKKVTKVFFQNQQSMDMFLKKHIVSQQQAARISGSGVDLQRFGFTALPDNEKKTFLLVGRMIEKKGVYEFAQAVKQVSQKHDVCGQLLGPAGDARLAEISLDEIKRLEREYGVEYLGETDDVKPYIVSSDVVVLPTYYNEGVPRVLQEAAAIGRPLITTNQPGCTDIAYDGKNAIIVKKKNIDSLAKAMIQMIGKSDSEVFAMAKYGRDLVERNFDADDVIETYRSELEKIFR